MTTNTTKIIGTLGRNQNDVTCSILAAKSLGSTFTIAAFNEFELAAKSLLSNDIDAMLVPSAYPNISKFIMNEHLAVTDVFIYVIPSLVFASRYTPPQREYDIMYNHMATNPLLDDIYGAKWKTQENVNSNTTACLKVLESNDAACAITNAVCAEKYGLIIHQIIRSGINMPFIVFKKKENCEL